MLLVCLICGMTFAPGEGFAFFFGDEERICKKCHEDYIKSIQTKG
jgi:hypothetical protein